MTVYGYCRVSTAEARNLQTLDRQYDACLARGIEPKNIFQEHASGAYTERPERQKLIKKVKEGDTVFFASMDRWGRNFDDVVHTLSDLHSAGVEIECKQMPIELETSIGRFFFRINAAQVAYERERILENSLNGMEAARKRGRVGGRPSALTADSRARVCDRVAQGESVRQVAKSFNCSEATVRRVLREKTAADRAAKYAGIPGFDATQKPRKVSK